jgi:hypothetical protein
MKTWTRAGVGHVCGRCGEPFAEGAPMAVLTLRTTTLYRCASCAGPAPADVPARASPQPPTGPLRLSFLLPLGFSREPGQEG